MGSQEGLEGSIGLKEGVKEEALRPDDQHQGGLDGGNIYQEKKPLDATHEGKHRNEQISQNPEGYLQDIKSGGNNDNANMRRPTESQREVENPEQPKQDPSLVEDGSHKPSDRRDGAALPFDGGDLVSQTSAEKMKMGEQGKTMPVRQIEGTESDQQSQSTRTEGSQSQQNANRRSRKTWKTDETRSGKTKDTQDKEDYDSFMQDKVRNQRPSGGRDKSRASPNRTRFKSNSSHRSGRHQSRRRSHSRGMLIF